MESTPIQWKPTKVCQPRYTNLSPENANQFHVINPNYSCERYISTNGFLGVSKRVFEGISTGWQMCSQ